MTKPRRSYGLQSIDKKLGDLLQPLFHGSKKDFALLSNLAKNWHKIVGEKYAGSCYPKSFLAAKLQERGAPAPQKNNNGKLTIAVHNPAIGFFLENNSDLIIERLAIFCGYKLITKIIIKQEPRHLENNSEKKIHLSQLQQKILDEAVRNVDNPDLTTILKKIGAKILDENDQKNR